MIPLLAEPTTWSGWLFYIENLVIVAGYLFASLLITRRKSPLAASLSRPAWVAGLAFFLFCALTHIEIGVHAALGEAILNDDGTMPWHMHAIHIPQAVSIWAFLWSLRDPKPEYPSLKSALLNDEADALRLDGEDT